MLSKSFLTLKYFLSQGPHYLFLYARFRVTRFVRNLLPTRYDAVLSSGQEASASFFFNPDDIPAIVNGILPSHREDTIEKANQVCRLEFSFRGSDPVRFDGKIDWGKAPSGNVDWCWDLNRHGWFETLGYAWHYTGDQKYAETFQACLSHWIASNPVDHSAANWSAPFEIAFRINSWTWAWFLFADCPTLSGATKAAFLKAIGQHCNYLASNIELHARNNHLLLEAKSLLFGAVCFPQFRESSRWYRKARKLLLREVRSQVLDDGGHNELSTHYHRVIAGELLELLILLRKNNDDLPADIEERVRDMAEFEQCITRPDGTLPLFGDSSQEDTYARFPAAAAAPYCFSSASFVRDDWRRHSESISWRIPGANAAELTESAAKSRAFQQSGYYVMRTDDGDRGSMHMAIDCGPFGSPTDPHHGHADALSFEAFALGRPWLVDAGVYSTHAPWQWRRHFRGTSSHNTIVVDRQDQSRLLDSRRADQLAQSTCLDWSVDEQSGAERFLGFHNGYRQLSPSVTHYRGIWLVDEKYWVICDLADGEAQHSIELFLHSMPDVRIETLPNEVFRLTDDSEQVLGAYAASVPTVADVISGREDPVQGWYSENSGTKKPAPVFCLAAEAPLPAMICTVLAPDFDRVLNPQAVAVELQFHRNARSADIAVRVGERKCRLQFELPGNSGK